MAATRMILLISIMPKNFPLPHNSAMHTVRRDYSPYPHSISKEIATLLESARISHVTAIYYKCVPHYEMRKRRIGDDMFYYVARGKGEVWVEGKHQTVQAGDCAHFRRGAQHAAKADPRDPFEVIGVHYTALVFGSLSLPQLLGFPAVFTPGQDSPFEEMLHSACREYALRPVGWQQGLEALALRLLLYVLRVHGATLETAPGLLQRRELERVLPALEYLRTHLDQPLSVEELARTCHLSQPQFRRVFRAALGVSPSQYSRRLRMEEAALLLKRTDATIDVVASRVGYADPSCFAHLFKEMMGVSPGKYRAQDSV
jgi:AraC-like DNA-binding protein/mannose-6-phosphate isomerase-like protein (cupin superfamily)